MRLIKGKENLNDGLGGSGKLRVRDLGMSFWQDG